MTADQRRSEKERARIRRARKLADKRKPRREV